ncbi:MAG: polysaccharide deacetylase family protein [Desulfobacterales bacterium]|nr:polysaccharide deacetylase family protein [Desulfobacterales bacterium]
MREIPVIQYQNVGDYPENMMEDGILPKTFERQMKFFSDNNFDIVTLDKALDHLNKKIKLNSNALAITINGGYQDAYANALPVLKRCNLKATFFISPEFIGNQRTINGEPIKCLTWEEVRKLIENGMEVGLLAYRGTSIKQKYDEEVVKESIIKELHIFHDKLGNEIKLRYCAFKEGVPSKSLWKFIQGQGFEAVFSQCPTNRRASNRAIGRIQIDDDDHNIFLTKISKTYLFFKDKWIWKYLRKYKADRVAHRISDTWNWIKGDKN